MVRKIGKTTLFATIVANRTAGGNRFRPTVENGRPCLSWRLRHYMQCDRALRRPLHMLD
jgi:hypothetical protein